MKFHMIITHQITGGRGASVLRHGLLLLLLFVLPSPAASQPPSDSDDSTGDSNPSMGVITIVLIAALFIMGFFSMYIRHCAEDSSVSDPRVSVPRTARSRRAPRGLDPAVIGSFPTFDYSAVKSLKVGKGALECAVCLNEFQDHETLRLIPKCDHVFHPDCIDAWLASHTTCPVCRADLVPQPGESVHARELCRIRESHQAHEGETENRSGDAVQNDDVAIDVVDESMEQPLNAAPPQPPRLNRNRTRRSLSGRARWFGRFARSNSTGHVAVKQWENMDRFTLRLPEDVRRQIISGKLSRTTSCVVLPREGSSRRGNRAGLGGPYGEGSNRNIGRLDRAGLSDRWLFSLTLPFFSRAPSVRSPKVAADSAGGLVQSNMAADSMHTAAMAEAKLSPV